jgi:DNA-binding Lrp family transcriptional regulator
MVRVLDSDYQEFFAWQLEGIQKMRLELGRTNVWVQLNLALFQDVAPAIDMIKNAGLVPGQDGFKVGLRLDSAAVALRLPEFVDAGINFFTENREAFLTYVQMAYRSELVKIDKASEDELFEAARNVWTTVAEKKGVPMVELKEEAVQYSAKGVKTVRSSGSRSMSLSDSQAAVLYDTSVYEASSINYGNLINVIKEIKNIKGALVMGANTIFENAGTMTALKKIKEAKTGFKIAVWAKDKAAADKLKAMEVQSCVDIISETGLKDALKELEGLGISRERIVMLNSYSDTTNIINEFRVDNFRAFRTQPEIKGIRALSIDNANTGIGKINSMPLVISRAIAAAYQDQTPVVKQYQKVAQNTGLSKEDLKSLDNLEEDLTIIPLVKTTEEITKEQISYIEAVDKI